MAFTIRAEAYGSLVFIHTHVIIRKKCTQRMKGRVALFRTAPDKTSSTARLQQRACETKRRSAAMKQVKSTHHWMHPPVLTPQSTQRRFWRCFVSLATTGSILSGSLTCDSGIHKAHVRCAQPPVVVGLNNPPVRGHSAHSTCSNLRTAQPVE